MRVDVFTETQVSVVLSERNLRTLLAKLEGFPAESACEIAFVDPNQRVMLFVKAEPNEVHYADREAPGGMHPDTEAKLREGA